MGAKRGMLQNGVGDLIAREVKSATRFVDFFGGSGAVSTHVATKYEIPVVAYDLQTFSAVLSRAVVEREATIEGERVWAQWYKRAKDVRRTFRPPSAVNVNRATVQGQRRWCGEQLGLV